MDVTNFAWPMASQTTTSTNSTGGQLEEDASTLVQIVMWTSVGLQCMGSFLAWQTVTSRASELWQYLWTFGMLYSFSMFCAGVTDDAHVAQWQDARDTSYKILTFGALYITMPRVIDNVIGQPLEDVSKYARGAVEIGTELVSVAGGLFAIAGHGWFQHDILEHLPLVIMGICHAVNTVVQANYTDQGGKLTRGDRVSAAVSGMSSYVLLKAYQEGSLGPEVCMIAQLLALHTCYVTSIDSVSAAGAALTDTPIPGVPRLANDQTTRSTTERSNASSSVKQTVQDAVELGFTKASNAVP
jgi:hypothetical protein